MYAPRYGRSKPFEAKAFATARAVFMVERASELKEAQAV
jgi:hypothetical protein